MPRTMKIATGDRRPVQFSGLGSHPNFHDPYTPGFRGLTRFELILERPCRRSPLVAGRMPSVGRNAANSCLSPTCLPCSVLLKNVRIRDLENRKCCFLAALGQVRRILSAAYLPAASCAYMAAIFSRSASMLRPVSRVASTEGWPSPSVCITRTLVPSCPFFTI